MRKVLWLTALVLVLLSRSAVGAQTGPGGVDPWIYSPDLPGVTVTDTPDATKVMGLQHPAYGDLNVYNGGTFLDVWALQAGLAGPAVISIETRDRRILSYGYADGSRPDVAAAFPGYDDRKGRTWPIRFTGPGDYICVTVWFVHTDGEAVGTLTNYGQIIGCVVAR